MASRGQQAAGREPSENRTPARRLPHHAILVALLLACGPPSATAAGTECRESRLPPHPWPPSSAEAVTRVRPEVDEYDDRLDTLELDVDGDGRLDTLGVVDSGGSFSGMETVTLVMGGGERFEVEYDYDLARLRVTTRIPSALLDPSRRRARELIEDALFGTMCPAPDPSLERLEHPDAPLQWIAGPPRLPGTYTVRAGDEWLSYIGHNHAYRMGRGPVEPIVLAQREREVLLGTPHGVILTDRERSRHAWLYVSQPEHKLRFPSVLAARFQGGSAVITLSRGDGAYTSPVTSLVRVDLRTGKVVHRSPRPSSRL
jgi:hypothetical protein